MPDISIESAAFRASTKRCPICQIIKPTSEFHKHNASRDRLQYGCKMCLNRIRMEQRRRNPKKHRAYIHRWATQIKLKVLTYYGGSQPKCVICGENRLACLSIDHIEGGGLAHFRALGKHGTRFYSWLIKQGYPKGYQTLCMNCQWVKREENREVKRKD